MGNSKIKPEKSVVKPVAKSASAQAPKQEKAKPTRDFPASAGSDGRSGTGNAAKS